MFEQVIANVSANFDPVVRIDFPRQYMRFFRWHRQTLLADEEALNICADCGGQGNQAIALKGSIGGFEIFGQGIPQRIVYLSQVANFGRLHWAGTPLRLVNGTVVADPDAPVSLQAKVRVGHDDSPATYHGYINIGRGGLMRTLRDAHSPPYPLAQRKRAGRELGSRQQRGRGRANHGRQPRDLRMHHPRQPRLT